MNTVTIWLGIAAFVSAVVLTFLAWRLPPVEGGDAQIIERINEDWEREQEIAALAREIQAREQAAIRARNEVQGPTIVFVIDLDASHLPPVDTYRQN